MMEEFGNAVLSFNLLCTSIMWIPYLEFSHDGHLQYVFPTLTLCSAYDVPSAWRTLTTWHTLTHTYTLSGGDYARAKARKLFNLHIYWSYLEKVHMSPHLSACLLLLITFFTMGKAFHCAKRVFLQYARSQFHGPRMSLITHYGKTTILLPSKKDISHQVILFSSLQRRSQYPRVEILLWRYVCTNYGSALSFLVPFNQCLSYLVLRHT